MNLVQLHLIWIVITLYCKFVQLNFGINQLGRPALQGCCICHSTHAPFLKSRQVLSCYSRLFRFRLWRDIHCTNKTYFFFVTPCRNSSWKRSYEVSNLAFLGCSASSLHQSVSKSVSPSPIFPLILNTFPLSDFN